MSAQLRKQNALFRIFTESLLPDLYPPFGTVHLISSCTMTQPTCIPKRPWMSKKNPTLSDSKNDRLHHQPFNAVNDSYFF